MHKVKGVLKLKIICCRHAWSWALQIHCFDGVPDLGAFIDEVTKVLSGNFTLASNFSCLLALGAELFDGALETDAEVVGGETQYFAYR